MTNYKNDIMIKIEAKTLNEKNITFSNLTGH
jgi:hypothetical protein